MSSTSDEHSSSGNTSLAHHSKCSSSSKDVAKLERKGKGTHGLTIVRRMLENQENWQTISTKSDYHFPRMFEKPSMQAIYYTPDCRELPQACGNEHYLWDDRQLSKGSWNKDREIVVTIGGNEEKLCYGVAPCNGAHSNF